MPKNEHPHIIYILSDEHRGQAMGHAGDPNVRTPTMDRLASQGASFTRAYANCPVCTPSRGTLFSGRHAHAGPVANFFDVYKPASPSTATILREHGYHTAYFGKWHCGVIRDQIPAFVQEHPDQFPGSPVRTPENFRGGFQDWAGFEVINSPFKSYVYRGHDENPTPLDKFQTDALTDLVIDYLTDYDRDEPLFLVLSVEPPHFPCTPPEEFCRLDPEALQVRPNFGLLDPFFAGVAPELDAGTLRQILANYYGMIENLDWNMGRLMEALGGVPRFANTLTVYTSDHGDYAGCHGLRTTKIHHHEESVRIPSIFHWPGRIPAMGSLDGLFSLVDLMATTLGLAGIPVPPHSQGADLSAAVCRQPCLPPDAVLLEMAGVPRWNPRFTDWRGLVTERWKYAFYEDGRESLYDLVNDPYEMNELAADQPDTCARMRDRLLQLLRQTREPYFDVIIEYGVRPPDDVRYVTDLGGLAQGARRMGGLDRG